MLILEYALTEKEYLDYNFYSGWKSPDAKGYRISYFANNLLLYAAMAVVTLYAMSRSRGLPTAIWVIWSVMFIVLLVVLIVRIRIRFDKAARKLLQSSGDRNVLSATTVTISDAGILDKTSLSESKFSWDAFVSKVTTNSCYYLYLSTRQAVIIPFRVFQAKEREEFDKLLAQYFPLQAEFSSFQK